MKLYELQVFSLSVLSVVRSKDGIAYSIAKCIYAPETNVTVDTWSRLCEDLFEVYFTCARPLVNQLIVQ